LCLKVRSLNLSSHQTPDWLGQQGGKALDWAGKQREQVINWGGDALNGAGRQGDELLRPLDDLLTGRNLEMAGVPREAKPNINAPTPKPRPETPTSAPRPGETAPAKPPVVEETTPTNLASSRSPEVDTPNGRTPDVETPNGGTPQVDAPNVRTPEVETPNARTPEVETPNARTPEVDTPNPTKVEPEPPAPRNADGTANIEQEVGEAGLRGADNAAGAGRVADDPEAMNVLADTAPKQRLSELSSKELSGELDVVEDLPRKQINEPPYVEEVELPNGHEWKRQQDGTWCRFSEPKGDNCLPPNAQELVDTVNKDAQDIIGGTATNQPRKMPATASNDRTLNSPDAEAKAPETEVKAPEKGQDNSSGNRQRQIPQGGISIEERLTQGGNPPPHVRANPEKYYYDSASGQYTRRPEPAPDFSAGSGERAIPCFPKGVLVATSNGAVPIELLALGMTVRAFDEVTEATLDKPITALLRNKTVRLIDVNTDSEIISATTRHRFWVEDKQQWIAARYLESGMLLRTITGAVSKVQNIVMREIAEQDTYNLTVADCHTYFVGEEGLLVHNADETPKGKVYIGRDRDGNIIYVGQTKQDLLSRESDHHGDAIKEPEKYGFKKDMKLEAVMDGLTDDEMDYHERRIYNEHGGKEKLKNKIEAMGDEKINALVEKYCQ
jgi:hypothetical protein